METLLYCDFQAIEEYSKEFKSLKEISMKIFDRPEEDKSSLGYLQKNRILGLFLWLKETNMDKVSTNKIENEYKKFFKSISRSSISNYLNQMIKENVLKKEKVGKTVNYELAHDPPLVSNSDPYWIVKSFCIFPIFTCRISFFARKLRIERKREEIAYVYKLINYNLIKNRTKKCLVCPFGNKNEYKAALDKLEKQYLTLKNLLPKELLEYVESNLGELKIFGGLSIYPDWEGIKGKIEGYANQYKKELKAQIQAILKEWEINK